MIHIFITGRPAINKKEIKYREDIFCASFFFPWTTSKIFQNFGNTYLQIFSLGTTK